MKIKLLLILSGIYSYSFANCNTIDSTIKQFMQENKINGMSIALINQNETEFCNYGYTDHKHETPISQYTIFEIASITKTFTAMLASIATVNGEFSLKQPITKYVHELKQKPYASINSQELLAHVSGLPASVSVSTTKQNFINSLNKLKLNTKPQTQYKYSAPGVSLVGLALENVYKTSYQNVLQKLLLKPLNMQYTFVDIPKKYKGSIATPYGKNNHQTSFTQFGALMPSGSIKSNTYDLATYLKLQINQSNNSILNRASALVHKNYYCLNKETAEQLTWEYHDLQYLNKPNSAEDSAANPEDVKKSCAPSINHGFIDKTGTTRGMSSYIAYIPRDKIGVVILANKNYYDQKNVNLGKDILKTMQKPQPNSTIK